MAQRGKCKNCKYCGHQNWQLELFECVNPNSDSFYRLTGPEDVCPLFETGPYWPRERRRLENESADIYRGPKRGKWYEKIKS